MSSAVIFNQVSWKWIQVNEGPASTQELIADLLTFQSCCLAGGRLRCSLILCQCVCFTPLLQTGENKRTNG